MIKTVVFLLLGLIGVWISAFFIVSASKRIAKSLGVSEAFIGLSLLSIGTSLPEIFTHIMASVNILKGMDSSISNIAVGTNIGSNIIQITLITGLVGLFAVIYSNKEILKRDFVFMLLTIFALFFIFLKGYITRIEGFILFMAYIIYLYVLSKNRKLDNYKPEDKAGKVSLDILIVLLGLALIIFSANVVVINAKNVSEIFNLTGSFVGTMMIGIATALPELTTSLIAALRKSSSMSLGVLIGSNITNPLFALGIGAMISGYSVDKILTFFDIPFWFFVSLIALFFFSSKMKLNKKEAICLISFYFIYIFLKIKFFSLSL